MNDFERNEDGTITFKFLLSPEEMQQAYLRNMIKEIDSRITKLDSIISNLDGVVEFINVALSTLEDRSKL